MKINLSTMKRIIREEVEKQKDKIVQIAQDSCPCPDVDPKDAVDGITDYKEEDVLDALGSLDEEQLYEVVKEALESDSDEE